MELNVYDNGRYRKKKFLNKIMFILSNSYLNYKKSVRHIKANSKRIPIQFPNKLRYNLVMTKNNGKRGHQGRLINFNCKFLTFFSFELKKFPFLYDICVQCFTLRYIYMLAHVLVIKNDKVNAKGNDIQIIQMCR